MSEKPTVYVVDDDEAMRKSTAMVLRTVDLACETFPDAEAFLNAYPTGGPGCLLLDLHMPGMNGIELLQRLRDAKVTLPVIIVSGTGTVPTAVRGMKLGVEDFFEKPVSPDTLLTKVKQALDRDTAMRAESANTEPIRKRFATLTPREKEILKFIVDGLPNKLIARQMNISIKTVENHRARLVSKMEASNTADLVRMNMLIQPGEQV